MSGGNVYDFRWEGILKSTSNIKAHPGKGGRMSYRYDNHFGWGRWVIKPRNIFSMTHR